MKLLKGKEVPRGRHCAAWSLQLRQALMADTALAPTTAFNTPISPSITHDRLSFISDFETKQQRMASAKLALWLGVAGMIVLAGGGAETIAEKCAAEFQKVTQCLSFVTAKAAAPSKDCCSSVTELKDTDPACLCYIIEQVHNGSNPAVKSMGVQESRLLQLPSACKLANASITECPSNYYPSHLFFFFFSNFCIYRYRSFSLIHLNYPPNQLRTLQITLTN